MKNKFKNSDKCFENVEQSSSSISRNSSPSRNSKSKPSEPSATYLTDLRPVIAKGFLL